ncbi:TerD family protein [Stratiformator vulcanicus]|uniref:Cytoplasmic protein n=1 Tax=Stratiformator vulcanicus TaxID=2527980 RepID=A0A517R5K9_9PLAN|nr:TerD family protein [Stratiformator vulcanicus]QDT39186.1 hypothetical protein Pan189_35890 [Stratiformator vulcanicus]
MVESLTKSEIFLAKCGKVLVGEGDYRARIAVVSTVAKNLQSLGFGLSSTLLARLSTLSDEQVVDWYEGVSPLLRRLVGANRPFEPMYPNFPRQVMEASEAELYFNAMTHYFGFALSDHLNDPSLVVLPNYEKESRPPLDEFHQLRWIDLGSEIEFRSIFTRLVSANGSLSEFDKRTLKWFAANESVQELLPERIPQKENLAFLVSLLEDRNCLIEYVKTATDVLRIAVAMSGGDVSLGEPTKFRSFSKPERKFLLKCLENSGDRRTEDMLRWKSRWIRLGEFLHPGDYKKRFPNALAAFDVIRNDIPFKTFNAKVEESISRGDPHSITSLLTQRPGEFARRLDHILRSVDEPEMVLTTFFSVAGQVSTPVLLQAWAHFRQRDSLSSRAFFPKGNAAKVQFSTDKLPPLAPSLTLAAARGLRSQLMQRFARLPRLGKVWIDERLTEVFVPHSQRSASRSLRAITRGSSFQLPSGDTLRFFCWWKNIYNAAGTSSSRVDLDLSASLFSDNWQTSGEIAYYNLRSGECYHSGDVTSAPKGACEFIDISLESVRSMGARYVVMSVLSYTGQPFAALPECFGGWMIRKRPNSGEIFEPKTVVDKIDITASTRACVPVIVDAEERRVHWADLGLKSAAQINNAARNSVGLSQIGQAIVDLKKPTLYDLLEMHAEARGEVVQNMQSAETVFGLHEGDLTAFDSDRILSEFLA